MTTTDIDYPSSDNKLSTQNAKTPYKISLNVDEPILEISLGKPQRGGQHLGKKRRIKGFYIDSESRVYAEYLVKHDDNIKGSGSFYQYAIVGRHHVLTEESV